MTRSRCTPLLAIARQAGFTQQSFEECLANQQVQNGIEEVRQRAVQRLNVQSTPTFFVNGKLFRGTLTIQELDKEMAPISRADKGFFGRARLQGGRRRPALPGPAFQVRTTSSFCCGITSGVHSPADAAYHTSTHPPGTEP